MTIRDLLLAVSPFVFYGSLVLSLVALGYIVTLSLRHRRTSSIVQVGRLLLTVAALKVTGLLSRGIDPDLLAIGFGLLAGAGIAWWYGRHTIRGASLGVNVSLIVLVASLMMLSITLPEWLDPRSFLIAGSLVGIRLLIATSPQTRLEVPSRRKGDRAMRIATIWMLLLGALAVFTLAAWVALNDGSSPL